MGASLEREGGEWKMITCLYADDAVLLAENEEGLQRAVTNFNRICERRKCKRRRLKVNAGKSKVMVFERKQYEEVEFKTKYRVKVSSEKEC